jgi:hypothetical protein
LVFSEPEIDQPLDTTPKLIIGDCTTLTTIFGNCTGFTPHRPQIGQVSLWTPPDVPIRSVESAVDLASVELGDGESKQWILVSLDDRPLDLNKLAKNFNTHEGAPIEISWPGQAWVTGAWIQYDQFRWMVAGGVIAALVGGTTAVAALFFEFLRLGRRIAPVGALTGTNSLFLRLAGFLVGLPLAVAALVGTCVGVLLIWNATRPTAAGQMPLAMIAAILGTIPIVLAVAITISAREMRRASSHWTRATADE